MARILVVDDDPAMGRFLALTLKSAGHEPERAETFGQARRLLLGGSFDLVVCDVYLDHGHSGLDLLSLKELPSGRPPFVFVTGAAELETAIEALRLGAFDYIPKPIEGPRLLLAVAKAIQVRSGTTAVPSATGTSERFVGRTPQMVEVFTAIGQASRVDSPVLLVGEMGVGKEHTAREIHRHSPRKEGPFVIVDASVLPGGELPASILRAAAGGTLYVERVDALTPPAQTRLARMVEKRPDAPPAEQPFDVRFIGSVESDGESLARPLYYALSAIEIHIPPLRARREDIPLLVEQALGRIAQRVHRPVTVDPDALAVLRTQEWRGNIHELLNALERAAVHAPTGVITITDIHEVLESCGERGGAAPTRTGRQMPETARGPRFQGDRYVLTRLIRRTDMSETWEGVQPALGRKVLVKFLNAIDEGRTARFQREARIQAGLRHPHIPVIHEAGTDPEIPGRLFLVMDYIEGSTLEQYVAHAGLALEDTERVRRVCRLARQVALALDYLHERGVVHRDVKPENIMVTDDGQAFLLDYGIARQFSHSDRLTATDLMVGSLAYMAPEQLSGPPEGIDGRADQWGLGVTLYALLTGRLPFEGETLEAVSMRVTGVTPPPPRKHVPTIPSEVEGIILRALQKLPEKRFPSARAMADALERVST